ncbi:hypothetical protein DFH09DRAFT_1167614 [Mycena vulgaris]|nr:hypothetical protein DFH09DRAFT_1167614 [Mycena vulgaris]
MPGTVDARLVGICASASLDAYKGLHEGSSARAWDVAALASHGAPRQRLIRASHPSTGASPHAIDDRASSARRGTANTLTTRKRIALWPGRWAERASTWVFIRGCVSLLRFQRAAPRFPQTPWARRAHAPPRCARAMITSHAGHEDVHAALRSGADGARERLLSATSACIPHRDHARPAAQRTTPLHRRFDARGVTLDSRPRRISQQPHGVARPCPWRLDDAEGPRRRRADATGPSLYRTLRIVRAS